MNGSQVKNFADSVNEKKQWNAGLWVSRLAEGMLTLRANDSGSHLYESEGHIDPFYSMIFPLEKKKILVGA